MTRASVSQGQVTRFTGFYKVKEISGNRFDCMLCHAPQAENASPLVQNDFSAEDPKSAMADTLKALNEEGKF